MKLFRSISKSTTEVDMASIDTIIGPNTIFKGTLQSENSICIEGEFFGQLASKGGVLINSGASLEANIYAEYVVVHGKVTGNITAQKQLDITATGHVRGDVEAPSVVIAKGGVLDGFCRMATPVEKDMMFPKLHPTSEPSPEANELIDDIIVPLEMGDPFRDDEQDEQADRIHIIKRLSEEVNSPAMDDNPLQTIPVSPPSQVDTPEEKNS